MTWNDFGEVTDVRSIWKSCVAQCAQAHDWTKVRLLLLLLLQLQHLLLQQQQTENVAITNALQLEAGRRHDSPFPL